MKALVVLRSGRSFATSYANDYTWNTDSLTKKTIHKLVCDKEIVFVQGDEISCIVISKES